jgi:hypothetical protein
MEAMQLITVIASLTGFVLAGANAMIFCIIKFNDLKHQEDSLKRIEAKLADMDSKLDKTSERISRVEGKCQANHG